jgi:hypothetical protein
VLSEIPGDCSPSRSVVSKMWTRLSSGTFMVDASFSSKLR